MIYLDNNASTRLDPEVLAAMTDAAEVFGNPSSVHAEGQRARRAIEGAREAIGALIGAAGGEVFLTSGGTESNALAMFGAVSTRRGRIVISGAEHPSVREPAARLASSGQCELVTVDPEPSGALDPGRVLAAAAPGTLLVSVMAANNEYGGVFPVAELAPELRRRGVLFHVDAVQAAGRLAARGDALGADLVSISAHKMHGPKGAGALFVRRGIALEAHTPGGGQEKKLRAGTENTPAIVGFGLAAALAARRRPVDAPAIARRRDRLERGILERINATAVVGAGVERLPNTSAVAFAGASGEALLIRLDLEGVAVSVGSACSSGTLAPSPALLALGLAREEARSVVRFSLSRETTDAEIARVLDLLPAVVEEVRAASPRADGALAGAAGVRP
ncbi:MAG TPA: cysteine desulfurase family protein [Thermoanaerobaculia bacterium]|nr:cysteine desulfurase family protein [Thermoanaerobaculia bacterium]